MDKESAKKRIEELREKTEYYATKYYDEDSPEISDFEYDMLMVELRNLEAEYPDLIDKNSLTQKVGGHVKEGFEKVEHEVPLQSLQDVFTIEELLLFDSRVRKETAKDIIEYTVETKIDGLSVALEYVERKIYKRGNTWKWTNRRRCYSKFKDDKEYTKRIKREGKYHSTWRSLYF